MAAMILAELSIKRHSATKRRRLRRKRLHAAKYNCSQDPGANIFSIKSQSLILTFDSKFEGCFDICSKISNLGSDKFIEMSSIEDKKSRDAVLAAREAKKLAKLKAKNKGDGEKEIKKDISIQEPKKVEKSLPNPSLNEKTHNPKTKLELPKSKDEVDRAVTETEEVKSASDKSKDEIKSERAAKKAIKQAKKKKDDQSGDKPSEDMTVKDVVDTLKDIVNVAKEVQDVTAKVQAISLEPKKAEDSGKAKSELKAERRAKQEAQRAAKQAAAQQKIDAKPKPESKTTSEDPKNSQEEKVTKTKVADKSKQKQIMNRINWFKHLQPPHDKESLKNIPINSNLHPAIVKLGVQLASKVVTGSNARCIALLDAMKKMVRDYTLPAKTEFSRGLEAHLAASVRFLWAQRPPSAAQTNALKFFRHHLTQLPNNVDEFDAKKTLQEEIDRYIREQIDMAGEAISLAVRNKISDGDNILTYGCSSLIERILSEAWEAGVKFRAVVCGARGAGVARDALRRLAARGPCLYADLTAINCVMPTINKVILGASELLVNGWVVGRAGTAQVALAARAHNVPVLVACETHKVCTRGQTDAFLHNELGDPDELIDKNDTNSPLKDWRSNPNLTPLNLTYDVTPPSLVTAVVTELAILPCTSAPVVLRFKLSEYGL